MNAAPHSPLVARVASALKGRLFVQCSFGDGIRFSPNSVEDAAQAALDACHAEELARMLAQSATELETAAEVLGGQGLTGLSSIFTEAASRNRALLAKLDGQS